MQAAKDLNLSAYAATIAVATAMQESSLHNLTTATNADSLGLFQQRPSMGWGTASELTDPTYAAKAFLKELPSDYQNMNLADAAQSVQRSFDGSLYSQWECQAAYMVHSHRQLLITLRIPGSASLCRARIFNLFMATKCSSVR